MSSYYQGTSLQCFTDATAQISDLWSLLSKSKTERTHKEVEPAINFLKGLSVFTSMQSDKIDLTELLLEFLEVMQCEAFQKGETIFNYKDKPSKFYIILRGSVDIYVPKTSEERKTDNLKLEKLIQKKRHSLQRCSITEEKNCEFGKSTPIEETNLQKTKQFEQILSNKRSNSSKTKIEALNSILSSEDYFLINYEELASKLKKAKNLGPGSYFGEIALIMDCLRSAKVVASSDLHVATLSKDDYERILHQISCDFKEKVNFFIKLTGLNSNEAIRVARFCYGFKEKKYTFGQKIFKQGEISQEVFIVKQGEVQISTQEILDKEYHLELVSPCLQKKKRFLTRKLAILNAYNFLGESEALTMKPYDTTAASSSNETILYIIPAHEFRRLQAEYKDIFKKISIKYETKASYFKGRIESLNAFENPATDRPPSRMRSHNGTPRILSNQDIQNIHSSKLIQEKAKKLALPKVQDIPLKRPPKSLRNYYSSKAQDEDLLSPVSLFSNATSRYDPAAKNVSKLFPKGKTESTCPSNEQTPKNTSKDRSTFGDYFSTSIGDVVHKEQKSQEFPDSINSRLSRFISKLKNRKLKESTRPSAAILIKSRKFEEDRYKSLKVQTKESTVLDKDSLASSSSEGDSSIFDNTQIFTKNKKSRCSIIHHIK